MVQERSGTITRNHYTNGFTVGASVSTAAKYQTLTDHLGNVREVVALNTAAGSVGAVAARYDYSAYQGPQAVGPQTLSPTHLTIGRYYHHAGSGLELALYRAYDPELGRWLNEDPIQQRGGLNLYGYVGNSPLMWTDPLGLEVDGTYSISTGKLTITDRDGKGSASLSGCSSGTNNVGDASTGFSGPVPPGKYRIYPSPRQIMGQDAYILDPIDGNEGNDQYDGQYNNRYGFRMHLEDTKDKAGLKGSRGCIVILRSSLDQVKQLLNNTKRGDNKRINSPDDKNPGKTESFGRLPSLGTLNITN